MCKQMSGSRQMEPRQFELRQQANIVNKAEGNEAEYLFATIYLGTSKKMLNWVVDNGFSNHMTFKKEWFLKRE